MHSRLEVNLYSIFYNNLFLGCKVPMCWILSALDGFGALQMSFFAWRVFFSLAMVVWLCWMLDVIHPVYLSVIAPSNNLYSGCQSCLMVLM